MRRMLLLAVTSSLLALAVPGVASAHHKHGNRHASTHKRHAKRARVVTFGSLSPAQGSPTTTSGPSGEPAGKVASFENGVLTITLADKSTVSGKVTEDTEIECTSASAQATTTHDDQGGGDDAGGRDSGEHGGPLTAHASDSQGDQGDDDGQSSCTTAALVANAVVAAAELKIGGAGAVWEKVELLQ